MAELSDDDTFNLADIYLDPPSNEVIDEDCGKEDCIDMNNLTGGPLRANLVVNLWRIHQDKQIIGESDGEDEHEIVTHNRNRIKKKQKFPPNIRNWSRNELPENNTFQFIWNGAKPPFLNIIWHPISLFELFLNDEIIEHILEQSILYAGQKGDHDFVIGAEDLKLFFTILFTSGYNVLPRRRMYWENSSDLKNNAISEGLSTV
ncbi:piggyBac transposable element-derived protein 3 [Nephila pilipes]|uniref:PiggyBac transposable element-derived protein 3 n=1 Tax=Nephila pilipes TaxID=299642 RepID=A0A8X6QSV7_NEPPI|nr:piggyBac transposable element-derived protein 3 [Nephila pilipes]GFU29337.1 piggyBac transposable element-derived protein 3 [Nephila pilipes]